MNSERHGQFHAGFFRGVAVSFLTFLFAASVPFAGSVVLVFTPLPILYSRGKFGRTQGLMTFGVTLILVAGILRFLNPEAPLTVILFLQGLLGLALAELFQKNCSIEKTVLYSVSLLAACGLAAMSYGIIESGKTPQQLIEVYVSENLKTGLDIYTQMGIPAESVAPLRANIGQMTAVITEVFPALIIVVASFTSWMNILAARPVFAKAGIPYPGFGDLTLWKAPERLVWVLIFSGGLLMMPLPWMTVSGLNLLIVSAFVYFLAGLAIIGFFFRMKKTPRIVRIPCYLLVFLQQYLVFPVMAIGLFDLWIDFRKYIKPTNSFPP